MTRTRLGEILDDENFFVREITLTDELETAVVATPGMLTKGTVLTAVGDGTFQIGSADDVGRCVMYYETIEYSATLRKRTAVWRGLVGLSGSDLQVGRGVKVAAEGGVADTTCIDPKAFGSIVEIVDGVAGVLI